MMNTLFVLLDGMEDDPNPALDGRKPYEVAEMPFLHSETDIRLTTTGRAYTQLFLNEFFTGHPPDTARAALEAQGLRLDMKAGRTAFRLSPARIDGNTVRWSYEGDKYEREIVDHVTGRLDDLREYSPEIRFFTSGRAVLTMDYPYEIPDFQSPPRDSEYFEIPGPLGDLVLGVQDEIGVTDYPWGCGKLGTQYPPYIEKMEAVSSSPTALGVAASLGYGIRMIRDIEPRLPAAVEALEKGNVFLHFDEVDEYSHEKDYRKKIDVLERIDGLMDRYFSDADRIVFFVDHGTSCISGEHILMDVPLWTNIKTPLRTDGVSVLKDLIPTFMRY